MPIQSHTPITDMPEAPGPGDTEDVFDGKAYDVVDYVGGMPGQYNALADVVENNAQHAEAQATIATNKADESAASAVESAASAAQSAASANVVKWVSETESPGAFAEGDNVFNPVGDDYNTYRNKTGVNTDTDPANDTVNWKRINADFPDQTGNAGKILSTNGTEESWIVNNAIPVGTSVIAVSYTADAPEKYIKHTNPLVVRASSYPDLGDTQTSSQTYSQTLLANTAASGNTVQGGQLSSSPAGFIVAGQNDFTDSGVAGAGKVDIFDINSLLLQTLTSDNPVANGKYGSKTSISESGTWLAVSATEEDTDAVNLSGAVYIYENVNGTFTNVQFLKSPNIEVGGYFGSAVSITDNFLVITASGEAVGGNADAGRAYVYENVGGTWTLSQTLEPSPTTVSKMLACSISPTDNYLAVGAYADSSVSTSRGTAFIYKNTGGTFSLEDSVIGSFSVSGGKFGYSLAMNDTWLAVGAPNEDAAGAAASGDGNVYVFQNDIGSWSEFQVINDGGSVSDFGTNVDISGDTLIAGAPLEDSGGSNTGGVYVNQHNGTTFVEIFRSEGGITSVDRLGNSVTITDLGGEFIYAAGGYSSGNYLINYFDGYTIDGLTGSPQIMTRVAK